MPRTTTPQGYKINYEVCGNLRAEHTIIFSHGNGNSLSDWKNLGYTEILAPNFRLILMDALGYGDSDKPYDANQYTPECRAADVISVLNELNIEKAHFFGNSIGGSLGYALADLYPDRFSSFMIGSAHPYGSSKPSSNLFGDEFKEKLTKDGMAGFVSYVEDKFIGRPFHPGVKDKYLLNDPQALVAANTPIWPDRSNSLKNITAPVFLFAGALDPVSNCLQDVAREIPNCTVSILPKTDHCDAYWEGKKIAPLVENFIKETCQQKK